MEIISLVLLVGTSLTSLAGGLLLVRAFLPSIPLRGNSPVTWLARACSIAPAAYFARTIYRDLYLAWEGQPPDQIWFSVALNVALIVSEYCALRARLESIPEDERHQWGVLSAPWYPGGPTIRRSRKD